MVPAATATETTVPSIALAGSGIVPTPSAPDRIAAALGDAEPELAPAMTAFFNPPVALLPRPRPKATPPETTEAAASDVAEVEPAAGSVAEDVAAAEADTVSGTPGAPLPEPIASAAGHRVNVHVPRGTPAESSAAIVDALRAAGFDVRGPVPVNLAIGTSNARFFFSSDADAASAVVSALDGRLPVAPVTRNFSHLSARPSEGTIEFWLAGDPAGGGGGGGSGGGASAVASGANTAVTQPGLIRPAPFQAATPSEPPPLSAAAVNSNRLRSLVEAARGQ
jgi:hypothetical protein